MVALKTFQNLPKERQEEIILVALEEFALNDFQSASFSNIISRLGLAKGSFYRYFESKQSLYYYLLDVCIQKRLEHDKTVIIKPAEDFFELMLQHFRARIKFDKAYPMHSAFLNSVLHEKNSEELGNIQYQRKQQALEIIKKLVSAHSKSGQLRNDIDTDILAWMVLQTQLSVADFVEQKFRQDFRANISERKMIHNIPENKVMKIAEQFITILKTGMQSKQTK